MNMSVITAAITTIMSIVLDRLSNIGNTDVGVNPDSLGVGVVTGTGLGLSPGTHTSSEDSTEAGAVGVVGREAMHATHFGFGSHGSSGLVSLSISIISVMPSSSLSRGAPPPPPPPATLGRGVGEGVGVGERVGVGEGVGVGVGVGMGAGEEFIKSVALYLSPSAVMAVILYRPVGIPWVSMVMRKVPVSSGMIFIISTATSIEILVAFGSIAVPLTSIS